MNCSKVLESLLLGEDEHHSVVPVAAARVDGDGGGLVDHHEVLGHPDHPDPGVSHRNLMSVKYVFVDSSEIDVATVIKLCVVLSQLKVLARLCSNLIENVNILPGRNIDQNIFWGQDSPLVTMFDVPPSV